MKITLEQAIQTVPITSVKLGEVFMREDATGFYILTNCRTDNENYLPAVDLETGRLHSFRNDFMVLPVELGPIVAKPRPLPLSIQLERTGTSS